MALEHPECQEYRLAGSVDEANFDELAKGVESVLYLCSDISDEKGVTGGGFEVVKKKFPMTSLHIPLIPTTLAFSSPSEGSTENEKNLIYLAAIRAYVAYENALLSLPKPLLLMCRSGRRSTAVLHVFKAVRDGWSFERLCTEYADAPWLVSGNITTWIETVVKCFTLQRTPRINDEAIIFRQLFEKESCTYTYLVAERASRECILVDPVLETVERDIMMIRNLGLKLKYTVNTHLHADHITGSGLLKKKLSPTISGALQNIEVLSAIAEISHANCDIALRHGDSLSFGTRKMYCLATPGHTNGCVSFLLDDMSLICTGDTLLIGGCGRTDFQEGNSSSLWESVTEQIFTLPGTCVVYPAHDYNGQSNSDVAIEIKHNRRLGGGATRKSFIEVMANLNLPRPKKIDFSLPANLVCGV